MERFAGKTAVVTGASAGIGKEIVKELLKKKVNVVGLARRIEKLEVKLLKISFFRLLFGAP